MEGKKVRIIERRGVKAAALVAIAAIIAIAVVIFQEKDSQFGPVRPGPIRMQAGIPAPDFTVPALDGRTISLKDYRGKVVFLNVWATWCPTCREEMPSMEKLYRELKGEPFEILAISVDTTGAKAVAHFMEARNLSFPAFLDPGGAIIAKPYGVTGVPESYIIDKQGIIQKIVIGPIDWADPAVIRFFRDLIRTP